MPMGFGTSLMRGQPAAPQRSRLQELLAGLQQPETPALDSYDQFLKAGAPNREDYAPGFGRKLLAGLAGAFASRQGGISHGLQVTQGLKDEPYARAVEDYKTKGSQLSQLAGNEIHHVDANRKWVHDISEIVDRDEDNKRQEETATTDRWFKGEQVGNMERDDTRADEANAETARWHDTQGEHYGAQEQHDREMAEIARGNASTNVRNAATNERRASAYETFAKRGGRTQGAMRRVSVKDQDDAAQMATDDVLAEDPTASKFFEQNDKGRWFPKGTVSGHLFGERDLDDKEKVHREDIKRRIKEKQDEILGRLFDPYDRDE